MPEQTAHQIAQPELDDLRANAALLRDDGTIVAVNHAWEVFAEANRCSQQHGLGSNYLDVCAVAANEGVEDARVVATGIRSVINRQRSRFIYQYDDDWRLEVWSSGAGIVVAHFPIS